jgi:hypothetical protein
LGSDSALSTSKTEFKKNLPPIAIVSFSGILIDA